MSVARCSILLSVCALFSVATTENLPQRVSDDVRTIMTKAERAVEDNDLQLALVLYEGTLYSNGITLAIDYQSINDSKQHDAILSAIKTWSEELKGDFPLILVDESEKADVVLRFVDAIDKQGPDALGLIQLRKNYRWNSLKREISYEGSIQVVRTAPGGALNKSEVLDVVLHEFGHLLGLGDVSKTGVLMGPLERGKPLLKPTVGEVEDIRALRSLLRERIEEIQSRGTKLSTRSGRTSSSSEHAVRVASSH